MPFFRTFLFSTVLLAVASVCPARDIHVAATGSDTSGAGTAASPYREIRKGLTVLAPGDTLLISAGAYKGFDAVRLGSANTVTTIRATEPGVTITPTTDRGSNNSHNIVAWLCTNVVFEGLTSNNAPIAGLRLVECNNVTVRGGTFANNGKWGIVTSHCYDLLLENNDCSGSVLEHGIYVANSGDRPVVRGNRIHGNANSGLRLSGDANQGGDGIISGALIENNIIYDNGSNGGGAMNMDGLQDSIVRNNLIYNNRATGIALFKGLSSAGSTGVQVLNNTIIVMSIGRYCLRITDVVGPLTVRNNILYNLNTAKGPFSWNTPSDANFTNSDYNLFGGGRYVSTDGEYSRITMDNWMASGHETHSVASATLAQLFVAPSTHDYRLTFGSPALDRGTSAANVTKDILGVSRPQGAGVDIGAYESTPKQANTAPVAAAQTVAVAENSTDNVITLIATDTGTGDLTYQIVSPPSAAQGTLGPVTDNQVTFSPTPGFVGSTSFTFQASDSEGAVSNVATVKVNVLGVNAAPSFVIGANRSHPAAFATAQSVA
ncbi:MAG TPA: right-handed parallel beta-helix repeat-containing protein, partial [Prosthecobacter sp.]|nr:right-handed parallel beta-helix repeat-containing protein [Prosthecobacter sp.]